MSAKWFIVRALVAVVVIGLLLGLLVVGGLAIYRAGWSQGHATAQLAAEGEAGTTVPTLPYSFGYPGPRFRSGPLLRPLLLGMGLLFLLLVVIGKFFRLWAWKAFGGPWMMAGGPRGGHWAAHRPWHWHRPHGPMPPWCWGWEKPAEEKAEKAEPGAETTAAEA